MMKISSIAALIWMLAATPGQAQSDKGTSRLSVGVALGASFPSGNRAAAPGDPIYVFDEATTWATFAMTASYRLTSDLAVELTIESPVAENRETASRIQRERIEAAYPDYLIESSHMVDLPGLLLPSIGLSYRFRFGGLSVEPGLHAAYGMVEAANLPIQLKKKGANDYRSIIHETRGGEALMPFPSLVCRYTFKEDEHRYGVYLRAAYFSTSFDTPYTTSEESLHAPPSTRSFTTHHSFQALHVALGIHVSSPMLWP